MSVHIARVEKRAHGFTMLAEQDVPVGTDVVDEAFSRPAALGRWFDVHYEWPTCMDEPMSVGSALEFTVPVGPLRLEYIMIVADRVPGESLLLRTTKGAVDATVEFTWKDTDGGVQVGFEGDFRVRGSLWWKCPCARALMRRAATRALERMREDLIEQASASNQLSPVPVGAGHGASRGAGGHAVGDRAAGGRAAGGRAAHRKSSGRRRAHSI